MKSSKSQNLTTQKGSLTLLGTLLQMVSEKKDLDLLHKVKALESELKCLNLIQHLHYWIPINPIHLENIEEAGLSHQDPIIAYVLKRSKNLVLDTIPSEVHKSSKLVHSQTQTLLAIPAIQEKILTGIWILENEAEPFTEQSILFFETLLNQVLIIHDSYQLSQRLHQVEKEIKAQQKALQLHLPLETSSSTQQTLIGSHPLLLQAIQTAAKSAKTKAALYIQGESGTGKELIAKLIHEESSRKAKPFVSINCGALQESLAESELFGHLKGAFTDARDNKIGLVESAHGGTLFLDEIADLSLPLQTKLLRFIQEGEFYKVGSQTLSKVDVRIVSASHKNLSEMVSQGLFREDLYFRLNTIQIEVPSLRQRKSDLPELIEFFVRGYQKEISQKDPFEFESGVMDFLLQYDWPGNIRELKNTLTRLMILSDQRKIKVSDLPLQIRMNKSLSTLSHQNTEGTLEEVEKNHILKTLTLHWGNKTKAADSLGITVKTLYNKLHRYGLNLNDHSTQQSKGESHVN